MSTQETRECLLCLRIPLEKIRSSVEDLLPHVDDAVIDSVAERAAKLIASAYEQDRFALCGKKPSVLMAAAIYLSGKMEKVVNITQGKIAEELKISEPSIRLRARQLDKILGLEFGKFTYIARGQYVCPFCKEAFQQLKNLKAHLLDNEIKGAYHITTWMFNNDGILVDKKILERLKRRTPEEQDRFANRLERLAFYLCPFCEKEFSALSHLESHLEYNGVKPFHAKALRIRMFNKNGILVDEEILEKMKKNHKTPCKSGRSWR